MEYLPSLCSSENNISVLSCVVWNLRWWMAKMLAWLPTTASEILFDISLFHTCCHFSAVCKDVERSWSKNRPFFKADILLVAVGKVHFNNSNDGFALFRCPAKPCKGEWANIQCQDPDTKTASAHFISSGWICTFVHTVYTRCFCEP